MWADGSNAKKWIPVINAAEFKNDIPPGLSARQCYQESRFNPDARNVHSGAVGLFQLLPQYFPGAGRDPVKDVGTATAYLASLAKRFKGDWQLGLAAYDWGPGSVDKWMKDGSIFANMPVETQNYVTEIIADVPVEGVLCKIQKSPPVGSQLAPSSSAPASEPSSVNSLWRSVTGFLTTRSALNSQAPPRHFALSSAPISSPIANHEVTMSTPAPTASPALVAASPYLKQAIADIKACINTILTGDPAQIGLRAGPAVGILVNQLVLLEPGALTAEVGVIQQDINSKLDALSAKLP